MTIENPLELKNPLCIQKHTTALGILLGHKSDPVSFAGLPTRPSPGDGGQGMPGSCAKT